jgi:hypothetical protein
MTCRNAHRTTRRLAASVVAWLALAPALSLAADAEGIDGGNGSSTSLLSEHGWRFVPLSQMLEQSQRQRLGTRGMPRLLPLAMLPMQHSALWLGLSTSRGEGSRDQALRFELRWSIPLDRIGGTIDSPALAAR